MKVVGTSLGMVKYIHHSESRWRNSPKGGLIQGLYKPIHGNCDIYFYPGVFIYIHIFATH